MQKNFPFSKTNLMLTIALVVLQFAAGCGQASTNSKSTVSQTKMKHAAPQIPIIDSGTKTPVELSTPTPSVIDDSQNSTLQPYIDELADHRLMEFSIYNSGSYGEGMRTEEWLDLCSGGSFFSHLSSTSSVGGNICRKTIMMSKAPVGFTTTTI
ncbi:MAG: hypothetical protein LH478_13000 [Chitinophagaceae bacterium]|nr:hypothetical protein [Chitinophagaceae bacterium]